jgi:2-dehydropantoate 2-reductase
MRVIIYGAGAVGGVVGGHLARSGQEVVLIGRKDHIQAINQNGLKFITPIGTFTLKIPAVTSPDQIKFGSDDVVFLTVRSQDTEEALRNLKKLAPDIPIFCFQNGVRNEETAAKYFPRVYGVMVRSICAISLAAGKVQGSNDPPARLALGCYPKGTDKLVEEIGTILRNAGFIVKVTPDVMPYKWGKLVELLSGVVSAISNVSGSEVADIIYAAQKEACDLLTQAGIRWETREAMIIELPMTLRSKLDFEDHDSAWWSLTRKSGRLEVEFLNGEIVRLANKIGGQAPINGKLVSLCLEMAAKRETPGKYTPTQLRQLLGLK